MYKKTPTNGIHLFLIICQKCCWIYAIDAFITLVFSSLGSIGLVIMLQPIYIYDISETFKFRWNLMKKYMKIKSRNREKLYNITHQPHSLYY